MANREQLDILKAGTVFWNSWRAQNPTLRPDLSGSELRRADLQGVDLFGANLSGADLTEADLTQGRLDAADLRGATLDGARLRKASLFAHLEGVSLARADLQEAFLPGTNLSKVNLEAANLMRANLAEADLSEAHLERAFLFEANLFRATLKGAHLCAAKLIRTNLTEAVLFKADLFAADLLEANLTKAMLVEVNLGAANLQRAKLVETNLSGADLSSCKIYGISAWRTNLEGATQSDLIITRDGEPEIRVDDLEIAQFIYLLIDNTKIRNVIDTVTSRAVLILGRFTDERKPTLESIREALRNRGYVPLLFDFPPSPKRGLTETVQLLANMSKFVIADLTDAKSIPQELSHIIPNLPSVPIQPILLASQREYAMFEHWRSFRSVLPEFLYESPRQLVEHLDDKVIGPVKAWDTKRDDTVALKEEIKELRAALARSAQN